MFSKRTEEYIKSFKDVNRAVALYNLNVEAIKNPKPRDPHAWNYIIRTYDENHLCPPRLSKLVPYEPGKFNLKINGALKDCNIFFNLWARVPWNIEYSERNPVFRLIVGKSCIAQITLKGSSIFCRGNRKSGQTLLNNEPYYPIYLFEELEKKFLDLLDIPHYQDIPIILECSEGLLDLVCETVKCPVPRIAYRNLVPIIEEYVIIENQRDYLTPIDKRGKDIIFEFRSNKTSPMFYLSFYRESGSGGTSSSPLKISRLRIVLTKSGKVIDFLNSKIIFRFLENLHLVHLFQSNDNDFLKDGNVDNNNLYGINLSLLGSPVKIEITTEEDIGENVVVWAKLGIFEFNVLSYDGACRLVF